nr:T9SS type A sorting domain-containing protein [Bacteroidota bacterium]
SYDVQCTPHNQQVPYDDFWVLEVKDTTVHVNENEEVDFGIKAYPNPASGYVCFEHSGCSGRQEMFVEIFNTKGILIESIYFYPTEKLKVWDTRGISPGIYFYRFTSGGVVMKRGKIVLQ